MNKIMKCSKCGWYHFGLSKEEIDTSNSSFSEYLENLTQSEIDENYRGTLPKIPTYEKCFKCGTSYVDMIVDDGLCPNGVTIQGIRV